MALSIQSNAAATTIRNQLNRTNDGLSVALERLGTGFRINSAKDDAAGLQIASRLSAQLVGQETAISNANNANSMLQTAEGAFDEMTNIVFRMKELATQGANGTNSATEYTALGGEYTALAAELTNILGNTSFGSGTNLLGAGGKFSAAVTFQIGASTAETLAVDITAELTALTTAVGTPGALTDQATSSAAITTLDGLLTNVGAARSKLGASMNRLDHTINNLSNMTENTGTARDQLMDADFAKETSNMTKQQLLLNSGISVLSTANSTTQMVSQLLR
ncbi:MULTISPECIES: flagellin N-terminal helical domain-containing protein [Rheinheimera]|jgi:flagellin|uniref:flagellin N-terminal helical domain-containing protein n=1 Tax=Rheinheimera TaxID=67575 RepID=UPI001E4E2AC6|nr:MULTISPECIES: flagellin [Rheinheimera]CAI3806174.1 Flagellin [Rheinheimera sp. MM224]